MLQQFGEKTLYVGLPHPECQPFFKGIAKKESVYKARINARDTDGTTAAHGCNALTKRLSTTAFEFQIRHHCLQSTAFRFETDCIYCRIHAPVRGFLDNNFRSINLIEIDRNNIV